MTLLEFSTTFSNEQACKEYYRDLRMKEGVICKKCGSDHHYWLKGIWQFQCSQCGFRTTLKSGTVMENSNLSFRTWFLVMLFMTSTKKGISASELQRQIGHKRYRSLWTTMQKIRTLMGKRDSLYQLTDMVEFDEGYFENPVSKRIKEKLKRGRGSQRQSNVAVMAESIPLEDIETGKTSKHCRYFKMKVLKTHKSEEIKDTIEESIDKKTFIFSDKSTSYLDMSDYIEAHISEKSTKRTTIESLKWVHIAISNAKRTLLGIYHKINGEYLQNYLNEFVYKLNRRYFKSLFQRILIASVFNYCYESD